MGYKLSKYLYEDEKEGYVFLYNTYKVDMLKIKKPLFEAIKENLSDIKENPENPVIAKLIEKRYLVEDSVNEDREGDLMYLKTCHSNRQLLLTILPTEGCNFRCEYCYEEHKQNKMSEETQEALIKFVRNNLKYYGGLSVSWFGGEPLLYPEIIEHLSEEFKKICKSFKKPYTAIMTTNGYLLDYDMFCRMKKCNVTNYQITIDGPAEVHDKQRFLAGGQPTYDRIISNLTDIKEKEKSKFYTFSLRTNLTVESAKAYPKLAQFLKENFFVDGRFTPRVRIAWNGTNDADYEKNIISDISSIFGEGSSLEQTQENLQKSMYGITDENALRKNFNEIMFAHYPCYAAKANSFIFGPDGRLFKCTVHFDDSKDGVAGYLKADGHLEVNDTIDAKWVTQMTANDKEKCYDCKAYPLCQGVGCPYKMSVRGRRDDECEAKVAEIISTFRVFSSNEKICADVEEMLA